MTKNITLIIATIALLTFCNCKKSVSQTTRPTTATVVSPKQETPNIEKVNAVEFSNRITDKKVQLVDVRTPNEYKGGHLKNAKNINVFDANFMTQMAKYKKDEPVYVYCRSGGRSMKAANMLKLKGYHVVNLNRGIIGWMSNGNKTVN